MDSAKNSAIKALLDKRRRDKTATAELAKKWLIEEGMLTNEGDLKPQYGGQDSGKRQK